MIGNQYLRKYITSQCSKLAPYFSPIHRGYLIIMLYKLSGMGKFSWEIQAFESLRHIFKHKDVVPATRLSHVRILQIIYSLFSQQLELLNVSF